MERSMQGSRFAGQSLSFWREEDLTKLDFVIPILLPANVDPRGRFPAKAPSMNDILKELSLSEISYISISPKDSTTFINLLVGRLVISAAIKPNEEGKQRIRLNRKDGIKFADNYLRAKIMSAGIRIEHRGILLKSGSDLGSMEKTDYAIASGRYAEVLVALKAKTAAKEAATQAKAATSEQEIALLDTVQQYIDVEFELEQATARETPPFSYIAAKPEPRPQTYRLFFRLTLDSSDYKRLLALKPNLLGLGDPDTSEVSAEIVNPEPTPGQPDIIISVEKQVGSEAVPDTGQLFLNAMPTLKNVRSSVIKQIREGLSPNEWFARVASATYKYPTLKSSHVDIPPSEYPPNPSQKTAIFKGAGTDDFVLVLGPPGTGKTTVILQWVQHFIKLGLRVLVTSQNNKAVDNVLERLAREESTECVRLGNESKVSDSVSHLLIDRFATNIQKKLVDRLESFQLRIEGYVVYLSAVHRAGIQLSTPAISMLKTKRSETKEHLDKNESGKRETGKVYLEADTAAREFEEKLKRVRERLASYRTLSAFNPKRWIGIPWLLLTARSVMKVIASKRKQALDSKMAFDKHSAEVAIVEKRLAAIDMQLQSLFEKIRQTVPQLPEPLLNEFPLVAINQEFIDRPSQFLMEIEQLIEKAKTTQSIVDGWAKVITTERQRSIYSILLNMVDVVGATCIGINTNIDFKEIPFDVVIVDESGQIQIQNLVVPLSRAPKAILVGDHKQLPPVVNDEIVTELEARDLRVDLMKYSWFEWLWNNAPEDRKVMLDTQFRCPAVISDYISAAFYENKYHAGKGMEKKPPLFGFTSSPILFIDTSSMSPMRRAEESRDNGVRQEVMGNRLETEIVIAVLEKAIRELPDLASTGEIGVIVPYANHVKQIQNAIAKNQRGESPLTKIVTPLRDMVASVDSYQGQERDLIILALTRSNKGGAVGFLADWRRLNVAMTRAKRQLIMVGDLATLTKPPRNDQSPDVAFKQAMSLLSDFVKQRCQLSPASEWVSSEAPSHKSGQKQHKKPWPPKYNQKPVSPNNQTDRSNGSTGTQS